MAQRRCGAQPRDRRFSLSDFETRTSRAPHFLPEISDYNRLPLDYSGSPSTSIRRAAAASTGSRGDIVFYRLHDYCAISRQVAGIMPGLYNLETVITGIIETVIDSSSVRFVLGFEEAGRLSWWPGASVLQIRRSAV